MCTEFGDASFLNPSSVARKAVHSLQDWAILNEMVQHKCEGEHDKFTGYGTWNLKRSRKTNLTSLHLSTFGINLKQVYMRFWLLWNKKLHYLAVFLSALSEEFKSRLSRMCQPVPFLFRQKARGLIQVNGLILN